jgi:tryptophanyl-tRNA synthetase
MTIVIHTTTQPRRQTRAATSRRTVTLTGVQPTGDLHLGNYAGAIRPLTEIAADPARDVYVFVADLHALNGRPDPAALRERSRRLAAALLACGLDRQNVHLYRQSRVPAVATTAALLNSVAAKGLLNRAHAYKAAVAANVAAGREPDHGVNMGLYTYPVLMAADILALDADEVPVGADQAQHLEIAIDLRPAVLAQLPARRAARAACAHRRVDGDAPGSRRPQDEQVL